MSNYDTIRLTPDTEIAEAVARAIHAALLEHECDTGISGLCELIADAAIAAYVSASGESADAPQPIKTAPEGEHILLFFERGERGIGGIEAATIYKVTDAEGGMGLSYWTHGGPNAGTEWFPRNGETPTHWMRTPKTLVAVMQAEK